MIRLAQLLLAATLAFAGSMGMAQAADPVAAFQEAPGICGQNAILNRIASRFRYQISHVPHLANVSIVGFHQIGESWHEPQIIDEKPIERRYCHASADMSDGRSRDVWYVIERPAGFAGIGSNVEFCVSGFDRWNVYDGRCRVLRPALW